jgi:hypothetical protein
MPTEAMTYDQLANLWGVSREAARKKVEGLHLPRQPGNDGKVRVMIDLVEVQHQPMKKRRVRLETGRRANGDRVETARVIAALGDHVETLKESLAKAEAATERERDRAERLEGDLSAARRDLEEERTRRVVAEVEAAVAPALRVTIEALKGALETEKGRVGELRAERDRLNARRSWWPFRRVG